MNNDDKVVRKEISTNLKSFHLLAYLLIAFGLIYALSSLMPNNTQEKAGQALIGGSVAIVAGLIFLFIGSRKRRFVFFSDSFEYRTNKIEFAETYGNIVYLKSFSEGERSSASIAIASSNGSEQVLSSAFLGYETLKELFKELCNSCSSNEDIEIDDELEWLKDGN